MTNRGDELESQSAEYLNPTADRRVDQRLIEMVAEFVIPRLSGERVLELGIGDQVWTPRLVETFADVTSVDGSKNLLDAMAQRLQGKRWTPAWSLFETYTPGHRFDTVLATDVLEHLDDPSVVLRRARQHWLQPGGRLAVVIPHALSLHRRLAVSMGLASSPEALGDSDRRLGHRWCFTHGEMESMIRQADFRVIEKTGLLCKPFPNRLLVHCNDDQLRGLFSLGTQLPIEYSALVLYLAEVA